MYSKPSAPRSISGVLDDGYRLGQAGFAKTWPLALAAQMLVAVPLIGLKLQFGDDLGDMQAGAMAMQSPSSALLYLLLAWGSVGFQNAVTVMSASVADGTPSAMGASISKGFRLLPRTLLLALLLTFGFLLIGVCFAIPAVYAGTAGRIALALLFLVPVCFYLGRIFLANPIFIVEDATAYASLQRSWHLTRHHYWRTSLILSLLIFMFIVALLVAGLITGLLAGFLGAALGAKSAVTITLVQLVSVIANVLLAPFVSAVLLSIYYDLKLRKEGT